MSKDLTEKQKDELDQLQREITHIMWSAYRYNRLSKTMKNRAEEFLLEWCKLQRILWELDDE